jgi:hypothetical protein
LEENIEDGSYDDTYIFRVELALTGVPETSWEADPVCRFTSIFHQPVPLSRTSCRAANNVVLYIFFKATFKFSISTKFHHQGPTNLTMKRDFDTLLHAAFP